MVLALALINVVDILVCLFPGSLIGSISDFHIIFTAIGTCFRSEIVKEVKQ